MTQVEKIEALCEGAGLEIMGEIAGIVINRENATPLQVRRYLESTGVGNAYEGIIAPAIDRFEDEIVRLASKNYYVQHGIGKARYVVNFHDGVKAHADGSAFYDVRIANNKRELSAIVADLERSGYTER